MEKPSRGGPESSRGDLFARSEAAVVLALDAAGAAADRVGPKAATLARLRCAGLPVPDGVVLPAHVYRAALVAAGVAAATERVAGADESDARRLALLVRLGLTRAPLGEAVTRALEHLAACDGRLAVRSSALIESRSGASLAGQLETFLGVGADELVTAVRACWASLWLTRTLRYLRAQAVDPSCTAVAVLLQRLVPARVAGGALSRSGDGNLVLNAGWGLGSAVAQGQVVPDRYLLCRAGPTLAGVEPGRKPRRLAGEGADGPRWEAVSPDLVTAPCLGEAEAVALARLVLEVEVELGEPVEVEWALDDRGFHILQARPLGPAGARDAGVPEPGRPMLMGQPAGGGRAAGPARVVRSEADLVRVGVGDVLVTRVPGPALALVLPRVAAVVAELGGTTSHLAALARERGLPAVLGVADATRRLRDGVLLVVDGGTGVVHTLP